VEWGTQMAERVLAMAFQSVFAPWIEVMAVVRAAWKQVILEEVAELVVVLEYEHVLDYEVVFQAKESWKLGAEEAPIQSHQPLPVR
jgi:hypothetical protein